MTREKMIRWLKPQSTAVQSGAAFSRETPLDAVSYAVLDTEFTSLDKRSNRLLSIGAIAMKGRRIRLGEQFYRVVNPGVPVPAETVVIHRLRSEDVESGEPLAQALEAFCSFVQGAVLVGHFVEIDLKILRKEMAGTGHGLDNPAIDTAKVHHWLLRHGDYSEDLAMKLEQLDLATLAKFYGVEMHDTHHALDDAFVTARIWQKMLPALQGHEVRTIGKLLRLAGV